ncbi:MAG: ERAP1-like C-terminal domain-containing protein [Bryobacteraceae bacterium]
MLLTKPSADFPLENARACPDWFFADANAAGYYAVSYEGAWAEKLVTHGLPHLKPDESAAALRNVQFLFSSALGDPREELASVREFSRSSDPGLARQAAGTIAGISDFVSADQDREYAVLLQSLYAKRARELGWKPQPDEPQETRLLRIDIVPLVATCGEDAELQSQASQLAREWLKDRHSLDPDMVTPVLSTAAWNGDRAFFDLLVDAIKKTKIQRERLWMIDTLSSFRDPAISQAALNLLFGSGIDPRELQYVLFGALRENRQIVWNFVQENFDRLNSTLPGARGIPFGAILPQTASGFCDAQHQTEVETFFQSRIPKLPGGARNLANTLERIRLCSARAAVVEPAITDFLNSYYQTRNGDSDAFRPGSH